jgi:site-specific DNA-methyltransferase (adenine-specific)
VWEYGVGNNKTTKDRYAFKHPAMFPEKLVEDHILSWSNEGDLVFDCFMGANTTGKMALLNNRKFIGIEKVEEYFEIAKKRIEEYGNG